MNATSTFQTSATHRRNRIYTFAYYWLGNREDAEDATQVVLTKWWKHGAALDPPSLDAWLGTVTRNACMDIARCRSQRRRLEIPQEASLIMMQRPDPRPCPRDVAVSQDAMAAVAEAISRLPDLQRSIVILREIQGYSYDDIATTLGIPLHQVKVYLHRGRKTLRAVLRERVSREEL